MYWVVSFAAVMAATRAPGRIGDGYSPGGAHDHLSFAVAVQVKNGYAVPMPMLIAEEPGSWLYWLVLL